MTVGLSVRTLVPAFSSSFFNDNFDGLDDLYGVERYDHAVATGGSPMDLFTRLPHPSTLSLHRAYVYLLQYSIHSVHTNVTADRHMILLQGQALWVG